MPGPNTADKVPTALEKILLADALACGGLKRIRGIWVGLTFTGKLDVLGKPIGGYAPGLVYICEGKGWLAPVVGTEQPNGFVKPKPGDYTANRVITRAGMELL